MSTIRAYVSHSIRGKMGKDATEAYMEANNARAIEFGKELRQKFPTIDFYVPGDHDEFVLIAFTKKYLDDSQILDVDCEIVDRCDILIAYSPDLFISAGMKTEINKAQMSGIPVIFVKDATAGELKNIRRYLEGRLK